MRKWHNRWVYLMGFVCGLPGLLLSFENFEEAFASGDETAIREWITANPDRLGARGTGHPAALDWAADRGERDLVMWLLEAGAPIDYERHGRRALWFAVDKGHLDIVKRLYPLEEEPFRILAPRSETYLHLAARSHQPEILEYLLEQGFPVEVRDGEEGTPLHRAAVSGVTRPQVIRLLLDAGADPNAVDSMGNTPLHRSLRYLARHSMALLDAGADPALTNHDGSTALHIISQMPINRTTRTVAEKMKVNDIPNRAGMTPLHLAAQNGNMEIMARLLESGARPGLADSRGYTPLHLGASRGHLEAVTLLVDAGAELQAMTENGEEPLALALSEGREETGLYLLSQYKDLPWWEEPGLRPAPQLAAMLGMNEFLAAWKGAGGDLNRGDQGGVTALHEAARRGELKAVSYLLHLGVESSPRDKAGWTPLDYAEEREKPGVVAILKEAGAESGRAAQPSTSVGRDELIAWLRAARKENGAYGPHENTYSDLAWNYPAVASLLLLGEDPGDPETLMSKGSNIIYTFDLGTKFWTFGMANQYFALFNESWIAKGSRRPTGKRSWEPIWIPVESATGGEGIDFAWGGNAPRFFSLTTLRWMLEGIYASGGEVANAEALMDFVHSCQLPDSSFSNGPVGEEDLMFTSHLIHTAAAVRIAELLGQPLNQSEQIAVWLRSVKQPTGGWGTRPDGESQPADVWYTLEALQALAHLEGVEGRYPETLSWVRNLQNADGGFGDHPGWRSRLMATWYALQSLQLLTGDANAALSSIERAPREPIPFYPARYRIFHAQHQTPPGGAEMVEAMEAMGFNFIGVSFGNGVSGARYNAEERGYHHLHIHSTVEAATHSWKMDRDWGTNHIMNLTIPSSLSRNPEAREAWDSVLGEIREIARAGLPFPEYRERVLKPLHSVGAIVMPEANWELQNSYQKYDVFRNSVGYNIVQVAHFNGPDKVRRIPQVERAAGRISPVADGDSHGDVGKWRPELMAYRTLYFAHHPGYDAYRDAILHGRVITVIRDAEVPGGLSFYGPPELVRYARDNPELWKWWDE